MNKLLKQAFEKAAELPEEKQNQFAKFLLAELESERRWEELFAHPESEALLNKLADEALADYHAGRTEPLKVEDL